MGEFPKLLWLPDGREVTAHDEDEQQRLREAGARFSVDAVDVPEPLPDPAPEPDLDAEI